MWSRLCILFFALIAVRAEAAEISELPSGDAQISIIVVHGNLADGDDEKFVKVALPIRQAIVIFESEGGNLVAGIEIGNAIKLKKFYTHVSANTFCASACALAWLAGTKRFMESGSRIGFHAAYEIDANGQAKPNSAANAIVGAYLNGLGLGVGAIIYITASAPESMQWLSADDANRLGIGVQLLEQTTSVSQPAPGVDTDIQPAGDELAITPPGEAPDNIDPVGNEAVIVAPGELY